MTGTNNKLRIAAVLASVSVAAGLVVAPHADAAITEGSFAIGVNRDSDSGNLRVDVNKARVSWMYFNHPDSTTRLLQNAFYIDGAVNGSTMNYVGNATEVVEARPVGNHDRVVLRHTDPNSGVEMTRTFLVGNDSIQVTVQLRNTTGQAANMRVEMASGIIDRDFQVTGVPRGDGYHVDVSNSYKLNIDFMGATRTGKGPQRYDAINGGTSDDAHFVAGVWEQEVPANGTLRATTAMTLDVAQGTIDTDGDGFPDEWEENGFTDENGNSFPLNQWGADPKKVDLFLQLNWMKSEWETKKCSEQRKYAPTEEDFRKFLDCSEANTNVYRPSRQTLNDLVDAFAQQNINLHIDAGEYYNPMRLTNPQGGPTEDFTPYYFEGKVPGIKLLEDRDRLLKGRQTVFRVGLIGDQQTRSNFSSGNALIGDGAFYVAKNRMMTSQDQLRNTILHEFGHNLGLTHSGPLADTSRPISDYVPGYLSVMNYLYQFTDFRYSNERSRPQGKLPEACKTVQCYTGDYDIEPDWPNLAFIGGQIGRAHGTTGSPGHDHDHEHEHANDEPTVRELEVYSAEFNNGKAGLRVRTEEGADNMIIANRTDSKVSMEIANLGIDIHKFRLQATYPGGRYEQEYTIEGALSDESKLPITVPITNTAGYTGSTMPVTFRVFNQDNDIVADDTIEFSVLNYNGEDTAKLIKELRKKNSDLLNRAEQTVGKEEGGAGPRPTKPLATQANAVIPTRAGQAPVTSLNAAPSGTYDAPSPATSRPSEPSGRPTAHPAPSTAQQQNPGKGGETGGLSGGAIAGIVVGLLALIGILGAAAVGMGGF